MWGVRETAQPRWGLHRAKRGRHGRPERTGLACNRGNHRRTDFSVYEPIEFSSEWFTHKMNGSALRYEVGCSVELAKIISMYGSFPAGTPDVTIFRKHLKFRLATSDEFGIADSGYTEERCMQPPGATSCYHDIFGRVPGRHRTVNRRLKQSGVLSYRFRHELPLH